MVFDGRDYSSAQLIPPIAHHPSAPAIGTSIGGALRIAYLAARRRGQYIGSIVYKFPSLHPPDQQIAVVSASAFGIAEAKFRRLVHVNAVRCVVDYYLVTSEPSTARFTLAVTDGSLTDSASAADRYEDTYGGNLGVRTRVPAVGGGIATIWRGSVAGERQLLSSEVTTSLSTVSEDATLTCTLSGYADGQIGGAAAGLLPVSAHFWGVTLG